MSIGIQIKQSLMIITLQRPAQRNAVDGPTAKALADTFREFEHNDDLTVAILTGEQTFCAGADLKAVAEQGDRATRLETEGDGPMGPTRMQLSKPVIAAIEGHAVAGGLELALWCDLRIAAEDAVLGVFCRRFGVPLIDGGTVRLPRLIGESRAMDLILTGRPVSASEALEIGLVNRLAPKGEALAHAEALAQSLCLLPQICLRSDRASMQAQHGMPLPDAIAQEFSKGMA
ncbi:MAG TPA: crotonase/enoyl-CoA hydratase family protein, partial [Porticoccus sp.]|nr:crotonase/enoyl-CoA hydratase family protein [Porticoccus sp.]